MSIAIFIKKTDLFITIFDRVRDFLSGEGSGVVVHIKSPLLFHSYPPLCSGVESLHGLEDARTNSPDDS